MIASQLTQKPNLPAGTSAGTPSEGPDDLPAKQVFLRALGRFAAGREMEAPLAGPRPAPRPAREKAKAEEPGEPQSAPAQMAVAPSTAPPAEQPPTPDGPPAEVRDVGSVANAAQQDAAPAPTENNPMSPAPEAAPEAAGDKPAPSGRSDMPSPGKPAVHQGATAPKIPSNQAVEPEPSAPPASAHADPAAKAVPASMVVSAQQDPVPAPPSLRSEYSPAAAILLWQAGQAGGEKPPAAASRSAEARPEMPGLLAQAVEQAAAGMVPQVTAVVASSLAADLPDGSPEVAALTGSDRAATALWASADGDPFGSDAVEEAPDAKATAMTKALHGLVAAVRSQIAAQAAKPAGGATELVLHPAELGRIRLQLSGEGAQLAITIGAEDQATQALLQRHAADLRAALAADGMHQASVSFGAFGQQGGSRSDPEQTARALPDGPATPLDDQAASTPTPRPAVPTGGGLDLRL